MTDEIRKLREAQRVADERLFAQQNRLRAKERQRTAAVRRGKDGARLAARLEREMAVLEADIAADRTKLRSLTDRLGEVVGELVLPQSPQDLVAQLDDGLPCVLLPVRIETRFMTTASGRDLLVRVYPDDIAVYTHEKTLTRDEADSAADYWTARAAAAALPPADRERSENGAWRALVNAYGATRSTWIAGEIERRALAKTENTDLSFLIVRASARAVLDDRQSAPAEKRARLLAALDTAHPFVDVIRAAAIALVQTDPELGDDTRRSIARTIDDGLLTYLDFDLEELKPESWSRAPCTRVLPDRFVLIAINGEARREFPFPAHVPSPLILGPNPQSLEAELAQRGGDLVVGEDYAWIWDFDRAVKSGMALRVSLPEPFASAGFDRLLVLGLRVSDEPDERRALLEELLDNHRYSPGGFDLLAQGTPTNNTAERPAGFSMADVERDDRPPPAPAEPQTQDLDKTDAQRLAEAWDVDFAKLAFLENARLRDVSKAKSMNRALWPATLGFFLDELLEIEPALADRIRRFFTAEVVARGSLPAIRVGAQPYGVLVTSAFGRWQAAPAIDGAEDAAFLRDVHDVLRKVETQWQGLVGGVSHVGAGGDSFAQLLDILGLQATSVAFARRIGTYQTFLWNLAHLMIGGNFGDSNPLVRYFREVTSRGIELTNDLGFEFPKLPKLFGLLFSDNVSGLNGPLIDDVATAADERLSETERLAAKYAIAAAQGDTNVVTSRNYIGWLVGSDLDTLKQQRLLDGNGAPLPAPAALLYRMLNRSLLLASYDATMKLYEQLGLVDATVRREQDFTNVEAGRTVTRWEFMEAPINRVMPQLSAAPLPIGDFLATPEGLARPAAELLREVRTAIAALEDLATADLERLTAEHIDLCSYRLDAWQTALFARRLSRLNLLRASSEGPAKRGVHLGAYGWLEDVRPAAPAAVVAPSEIPDSLREPGVDVVEQPGNGGHIHGPSINHAVAAAVLRNAYLTHATQQNASHFSVKLTSERVRTAVSFLEGVRNGQELGALLGYQFERALHDRYVIDGKALAQFILAFRKRYPLVADKVTPDPAGDAIDLKEAYQVVDGYALLEAVFLAETPLSYPFEVEGLPADPNDGARQAIIAEVDRLRVTFDAIADLALAEGVFQVTQGNYERAGAMLKALSEGHAAPEPEIIRTPRGGAVVHQRIVVHLPAVAAASAWSTDPTPRSIAAPGLNRWLADRIGAESSVEFSVGYDLDGTTTSVGLAELRLQPIDLVYLIGDRAGAIEAGTAINDVTELEVRVDHAFRVKRSSDPTFDPSGRTTIAFMSRAGFIDPDARTLFEILPMLRTLRSIVTTCRLLGADDYELASEQRTDAAAATNPKRWDLDALAATLEVTSISLGGALTELDTLLADVPPDALNPDPSEAADLSGVDYDALRGALIRLAGFGLPDAFPKHALLPQLAADATDEQRLAVLRARQSLIEQASLAFDQGTSRLAQAQSLRTFGDLTDAQRLRLTAEERAGIFQRAAASLLGAAFRLVPAFTFGNRPELEAAREFAGAPAPQSLMRFTHARLASAAAGSQIQDWRPLAIDEWLGGVAAVRKQAAWLDELQTYEEAFDGQPLAFVPLQLPFDTKAHWVALEFPAVDPAHVDDPDVFVPTGNLLSIVCSGPEAHSVADAQTGFVIDEWSEVIPNRVETTGIAVHYDQPSTEPPQCVLVAVSPTIDGRWSWDDLVETLIDTFDRAKRRAVEPDFLRTTPYAQLLPAVLSTFTSHPFGTISTNLAAQAASMAFDGGQ